MRLTQFIADTFLKRFLVSLDLAGAELTPVKGSTSLNVRQLSTRIFESYYNISTTKHLQTVPLIPLKYRDPYL